MDAADRYHLVREFERIKRREFRNGNKKRVFVIAFAQFLISGLLITFAITAVNKLNAWFVFVLALLSIGILISGVYAMVTASFDDRIRTIIQATLSDKSQGETQSTERS